MAYNQTGDAGQGGAGGAGTSSPSSTSTSPSAPSAAGSAGAGAGAGGSEDIVLVGKGATQAVNAPALQFAKNTAISVAPNPNNAADCFLSLSGPQAVAVANSLRRTIKATANPFTIYVRNLSQIWFAGNAGDTLVLTIQPS